MARRRGFFDTPKARIWAGRHLFGGLIRTTVASSKVIFDPPEARARLAGDGALIFVSWHGQGSPALKLLAPDPEKVALLTSPHRDGLIMASAARSLGLTIIEGAGATRKGNRAGGGAMALRKMIRMVNSGGSLMLTADIPPVRGRHVSDGVPMISRMTGRPIMPLAVSSSRRITLKNWDRMQINLPFSRLVVAMGEPIYVPAGEKDLTKYSARLGQALDECLERAKRLADGG
ncbi:MAG: DUF374 domain-containing protein [Alphaproteobacteria bacterium]|nr:DUF374 domain-containing protein [Alphaproteobacteria bacterium]